MATRKWVVIPILLIFLFLLARCAFLATSEQDAIIRITARRLASHGAKSFPVIFAELAITARDACNRPGETMAPSDAFQVIANTVISKLDDRLLAADLKDLAALLGIRLDPGAKLLGLTKEQQRLVKIAVCSFAEGVELYP
ncbi:hypothetical protein ES703_65485 [subsurface metagenome]